MQMKAYYEYENGTFWAIRTAYGDCFTAQGNKYEGFDPESMQKAEVETEQEALLMEAEKSVSAIDQDAEFWRSAIEINAMLLFFVPDEYRTPEL